MKDRELAFNIPNVMAVLTGIVGLAAMATLLSRPSVYVWRKPRKPETAGMYEWFDPLDDMGSNAAAVIEAAGAGMAEALKAACNPVVS